MRLKDLVYLNTSTNEKFADYEKALESVEKNEGSTLIYMNGKEIPDGAGLWPDDKFNWDSLWRPGTKVIFESVHEMLQMMYLTCYGQEFFIGYEKGYTTKRAILSTRVMHDKVPDMQTEAWSTSVPYPWISFFAQKCFKDEYIKNGVASLYARAALCEESGRVYWRWQFRYKMKGDRGIITIEPVTDDASGKESIKEAAQEEIRRMIGENYEDGDWCDVYGNAAEPMFIVGWISPGTKAGRQIARNIEERRKELAEDMKPWRGATPSTYDTYDTEAYDFCQCSDNTEE